MRAKYVKKTLGGRPRKLSLTALIRMRHEHLWVSLAELGRLCGVSKPTLYRTLRRHGELPPFRTRHV